MIKMAFDWGSFFSSGVEELGAVAKAKDTTVAAEAKANAEEFAGKTEAYEDEITKNKRMLRQETDSIRGLGIKDVGKIRTIMKTYGNADVVKQIGDDFKIYQKKALIDGKKPEFTTLAEYVKSRISGAGTTMLSDEAAEQASDEAAVAGDELDIQKAEKKAKDMGVSLADYLENQAKRMSDRPAFNINARAARLVEESKMGLFGKTITLDEAKKQILAGKTMEGAGIGGEVKDLGDTGFALQREGGLSAEERIKLEALAKRGKQESGDLVTGDEILKLRKSILSQGVLPKGTFILDDNNNYTENNKTKPAMISYIKNTINQMEKAEVKDEAGIKKRQRLLAQLESEMSGGEKKDKPKPKPPASAISYLRNNPNKIDEFIKRYGENAVPPDMRK
tara:strand:- start:129 stop:1307 length:1179 start_codon:yes stop_codon:yes gene_type:complete